ncbi:hypothetical protein D3C76_1170710 [compost metagenome]
MQISDNMRRSGGDDGHVQRADEHRRQQSDDNHVDVGFRCQEKTPFFIVPYSHLGLTITNQVKGIAFRIAEVYDLGCIAFYIIMEMNIPGF